ncbi:hypothetical protein GCM10007862_35420 [Dyella lipolytica]|uniref:FHA domain-containing protein n=1 Tax=Dyella lipolytica TaxID=1867835 RepID=A0ABW8IX57_9GAMM|nr:FHA domain-containing protein [Dyella lipolytica]GLQ48491.1 hypothetical protein GCM10007862_35420 [Dyella lipolytica]
MNTSQQPSNEADKRRTGPQGTRLLSVTELQRFAREDEVASDGRATRFQPVLKGTSEKVRDCRYPLRSGRQTIGRRSDSDFVVDDPSVSASHAWIINQHGHYVIMNTLSTNGTFVNDKRVHEAVLAHGDNVRLGQAEFVFLTHEYGSHSIWRYRWVAFALLGLLALAGLAWWFL